MIHMRIKFLYRLIIRVIKEEGNTDLDHSLTPKFVTVNHKFGFNHLSNLKIYFMA